MKRHIKIMLLLTKKWIPKVFWTFCRRIWGQLSTSWSWKDNGCWNKAMIQGTEVDQEQNKIHFLKWARHSPEYNSKRETEWALERASYQQSQKYYWTEAVLSRFRPLYKTNLQQNKSSHTFSPVFYYILHLCSILTGISSFVWVWKRSCHIFGQICAEM